MNKILNIKKGFNFTEIRLFGFQIWKKLSHADSRFIKYYFLNGLFIYTYDTRNDVFVLRLFDTRYLELTIFKCRLVKSYKVWYLFFLPIFAKNVVNQHYKKFLDNVIEKEPDYDDYYIFVSHSGEFFLIMHHFAEMIKNNNSQNFLPVFTSKYHSVIFKMFYPDIRTITTGNLVIPLVSRGVKSFESKHKGKRIFFPAYEKYFADVENQVRENGTHYYEILKQKFNLGTNLTTFKVSPETDDYAARISREIFKDNFIILSPDSYSNELILVWFWNKLAAKFKEQGYEVYCNVMNFTKTVKGTTAIFLNYEEAIALSKYAKGIVGLRSGFLECLSQNNIPLVALYTDFPERPTMNRIPSEKVIQGFSIKPLPYVNKDLIFEYDVNTYDNIDDLIPEIVERIKNN